MTEREIGENFNVIVSTKKTLFGAASTKFNVYYAPTDDLLNKTVVAGGLTEAITTIAEVDKHKATTTAASVIGAKMLTVNSATNTIVAGDTLEYSTGLFAYVMKVVSGKIYLNTGIKAAVAIDVEMKQSGHSGEYTTADIAISDAGEYIVVVEGSEFGILVEQRVKVNAADTGTPTDPDAPDSTVAVAY